MHPAPPHKNLPCSARCAATLATSLHQSMGGGHAESTNRDGCRPSVTNEQSVSVSKVVNPQSTIRLERPAELDDKNSPLPWPLGLGDAEVSLVVLWVCIFVLRV